VRHHEVSVNVVAYQAGKKARFSDVFLILDVIDAGILGYRISSAYLVLLLSTRALVLLRWFGCQGEDLGEGTATEKHEDGK